MSVKSKLNIFNKCFMVFGMGSIHYNGKNWTAVIFCILRSLVFYVHFILFYHRHEWAMKLDSTMFDILSIVLFCCFKFNCISDVMYIVWRVIFDVRLSVALTKLEKVHETLIRLNVVGPMTLKFNSLVAIGVCVHLTGSVSKQIRYMCVHWRIVKVSLMIEFASKNILQCVACYEFVIITLYAKWIVNAINGRIRLKTSSVSIHKNLYAEILEGMQNFNRLIFGVPMLSFIGGQVAEIILNAYYNIIFFDKFKDTIYSRNQYIEILYLSSKMANLVLLFSVCHTTEKEVNRITSVLHQRSIVETNPAVNREIKCFILQTLHERFHFELCEFYKLDYGQLLTLLSKTFAFLLVQIQFKLNKIERE